MEMQVQHQYSSFPYSSLFTAGLLMAPRFPTPTRVEGSRPHVAESTQQLPLAQRRAVKLPEPLLVNSPNATSPQRKASSHRRRSSVTLQLSPLGGLRSPTRVAEDAWERAKRSSGSFTASGLRITADGMESTQTDGRSLLASEMNIPGSERMALYHAVYTLPLSVRKRNKRFVAPKPKPAPTSPLPDLPTFQVSPPKARPPFYPIQAGLAATTEDSNTTPK